MAKRQPANQPLIGIWWDDGRKLVAFTEPPGAPDPYTQACDSELNHIDKWSVVAEQFGRTQKNEYFSVPRGRVLWFPRKQRAIILHGNGTSSERLEVIARHFQLRNWKAETDVHYLTGTEADALFDDDES